MQIVALFRLYNECLRSIAQQLLYLYLLASKLMELDFSRRKFQVLHINVH